MNYKDANTRATDLSAELSFQQNFSIGSRPGELVGVAVLPASISMDEKFMFFQRFNNETDPFQYVTDHEAGNEDLQVYVCYRQSFKKLYLRDEAFFKLYSI